MHNNKGKDRLTIYYVSKMEPSSTAQLSNSTESTDEEASSSADDELVSADKDTTSSSAASGVSLSGVVEGHKMKDLPAKSKMTKRVSHFTNDNNGEASKSTAMSSAAASLSETNARVASAKLKSYKSLPISTRKFSLESTPIISTPPTSDEISIVTTAVLALLYLCIILLSWHHAVSHTPDKTNPVLLSPWIGQNNATKLIDNRLQLIQDRYQKILVKNTWKVLRMSPNVTIETMNSEDGSWPCYIRTTAIFDAQPTEILKHLGWLQFDETQRRVDRFHESAHMLFAPSHKSKVIRKTTKRPLVFPKREMTVALCEKTLKESFTLNNLKMRTAPMKPFTSIVIPKGTLMNAMVNVNIDIDAIEAYDKKYWRKVLGRLSSDRVESSKREEERQRRKDRNEKHIKAYQDMMGWFVPLESGGTLLVFVMQVDLGPDIPHWAFLTAVAATASWGMDALNRLCNEK